MTTHFMKLNSKPYDKIKEGSKTYELRLHDEKRQRIKIGDAIRLYFEVEGVSELHFGGTLQGSITN